MVVNIQREQPQQVLERLQRTHVQHHRIVVSAITYVEMRLGAISRKAPKKHVALVNAFLARLDVVLPWDAAAVDQTAIIKRQLSDLGTPIGPNDTVIAGHALAAKAILVTNNVKDFHRVDGLIVEDWSH